MSSANTPMEALVLAGRRSGEKDPLAGIEDVAHKALLTAGGKTLIARVVEALAHSGRIGVIRIAAPEDVQGAISEALSPFTGWTFTAPESSPAATISAAIEQMGGSGGLVVTTCDHALLTSEMVREFLDDAHIHDAAAACVEKDNYLRRFPDSQRTFITLKGFAFSGANLFWFAGPSAAPLAAFWRRLEQNRKKPLKMAREIGVFTALRYFMGAMTKRRLEATLTKKTGVRAALVTLQTPEAAIDVDKPADLALVRKILED
ncbi:MAG: nucleotidyltransferase family protein [Parvularculaceae bacterium]|nr:nucleotidyltransferase family protein [Parvularculaceae bacterium]